MKNSSATLGILRKEKQRADGAQKKLERHLFIRKFILTVVTIAVVVTVAMILARMGIGDGV